jgi:hypothetical protein
MDTTNTTDVSRGGEERISNTDDGEPKFLPGEYHAKGAANVPRGYSSERLRKLRMNMKLSRQEQLELPEAACKMLDVRHRPVDNSHYPDTHVGKCTKGWYDERDRSYNVVFRLLDNPDGRACAQNIKDGILNDISLTTLEEFSRPSDSFVPAGGVNDKQAREAHIRRCMEVPARAMVCAVAVCYKGARPGTTIRKQKPEAMNLQAVAAAWGIESEELKVQEVHDFSSCTADCSECYPQNRLTEASFSPMSSSSSTAAAPDGKQDQPVPVAVPVPVPVSTPTPTQPQADAVPMNVDPVPAPTSTTTGQPTAPAATQQQQQQPPKEIDFETTIRSSNMSPLDKNLALEAVMHGNIKLLTDVLAAVRSSNIPREGKSAMIAKLTQQAQKQHHQQQQQPEMTKASIAEQNGCGNPEHGRHCDHEYCAGRSKKSHKPEDQQPQGEFEEQMEDTGNMSAIDRALQRIQQNVGKTDKESRAQVDHTVRPLKDMLAAVGIRKLGEQPITPRLLSELAQNSPQTFATGIKQLYDQAIAGAAQQHVRASAGEANSDDGYTLRVSDPVALAKAERYLAALGAAPATRRSTFTMASRNSGTSAAASYGSAAASTRDNQNQNQHAGVTRAREGAWGLPIPAEAASQQARAAAEFDNTDGEEALHRMTVQRMTFATLGYEAKQRQLMQDITDTPIIGLNPITGQVTFANSFSKQMCDGMQQYTTINGMLPIAVEMVLAATSANADLRSNYHALGVVNNPDVSSVSTF